MVDSPSIYPRVIRLAIERLLRRADWLDKRINASQKDLTLDRAESQAIRDVAGWCANRKDDE